MTDSLTTPVPDAFSVSVLVEFVETQANRWEDGHWRVAGVVAGKREKVSHYYGHGPGRAAGLDPDGGVPGSELHAAAQGRQFLHAGLQMRLYIDDAESYYFNLVSDNPGVFVICNQEAGGPLQPFIATLSYGEATSYMETDAIVERVAMPPELYRWAERFVLEHYVPEKHRKRKRDKWKEQDREPRN
ncbi:MAG: DUF3305 domain-containing protein [Gammaproteobacteria bacterium]